MSKIYAALTSCGDVFDAERHQKEDLTILKLTLSQKEGDFAKAIVVVPVLPDLSSGNVLLLSEDFGHGPILLFKGGVCGIPRVLDTACIEITFSAEPLDSEDKLQALKGSLASEVVDDLFFDALDSKTVSDCLAGSSKLLCWDRRTHEPSLSSYFEGKRETDVSDGILHGSLKAYFRDKPIHRMRIVVTASWKQHGEGEFNVENMIGRSFAKGFIHTLTPQFMKKYWPKEGRLLRRSGYSILESGLDPFEPPQTGALNIYPTFIKSTLNGKRVLNLPLSWMKGVLNVWWRYHQRRCELVHINLYHQYQSLVGRGKEKNLVFRLKDMDRIQGQSHLGSFFESDRGLRVIQDALRRASMFLAASARSLTIHFRCLPSMIQQVDLDTQIILRHPQLGDQTVSGKVVDYRYGISAYESALWVTIQVSIGSTSSAGGKRFDMNLEQADKLIGILNLGELQAEDFVEDVQVVNSVDDVIQRLKSPQVQTIADVKAILKKYATYFTLKLKDLRTYPGLKRNFYYKDCFWSAPQQIDLKKMWRIDAKAKS